MSALPHAIGGTRTTLAVIAFHRPEPLARVLGGCAHRDLDMIVVNVDADPAVRAVAEDFGAEVIDTTNRGYAAAVNEAARAAHGDVIVFTNDDVVLNTEVVEALAASVRHSRSVDVALPRILTSDGHDEGTVLALPTVGRLFVEWTLLPDHPMAGLDRRLHVEKWRRPQVVEPVDAGTAVTVAVRADVLRAIPMPEEYFLYWEEIEWFWRVRTSGHTVVIVPEVTVIHDGGRDDIRPDKARLLARNAVRCVRRTQGRRRAVAAYFVVILWQLRLLTVDTLRACLHPGSRARARVRARAAGFGAALRAWREIA